MKKRRFAQPVLMITMLFCLTFGTVCAQAATTATTTTAKQLLKWTGKRGRTILLLCEGKKSKEYMENRDCTLIRLSAKK